VIVRILEDLMKMVGHILGSLLFTGFLFLITNSYAQYDPTNASGPNHQPEIITDQPQESNELLLENQPSLYNDDDSRERVKTEATGTELNTAKDIVTPQVEIQKTESTSERRLKEKKQETNNTDDSVLSFNFLYYMIQKFKFSDLEE